MNDIPCAFADAKRQNSELNRAEYLSGAVSLTSQPRALFIELTQGCNLRCPMCRDEIIGTAQHSMPDTLFDSIAGELFPTAEIVDLRGWGESLILPNILSRIARVVASGARLRIVTNLSFRRPQVLDALVDANAMIAVSLDAADQNTLSFLRRGADLELITSNLEYLVGRFGHSRNVEILTAVQRPALTGLPHLIDHVATCGVKDVKLFSVMVAEGSELGLEGHDIEVDEALGRAAERAREVGIRLIAGTQMGNLPDNRPTIPMCVHPWAYAYIAYNGDVSFCDHLIGPGNEEYVLGNLHKSKFVDIWNGLAWRLIREEHLGARRADVEKFAHCAWCYKKKYVDFEHLFEPRYASEIVHLSALPSRGDNSVGCGPCAQ
ncbi:MAG TPA: radical SAM protein [Bryobacteraceae bacterium]|jgi:radical SAM protein with 4Fe4S-binding SPASM domain|nr:radical SAM protein [Bryobacteraceae bacterium]